MARWAERDEYLVGTLISGLPTCVFPPKTYARLVTNIVVLNSVSSVVDVFRGAIGGTPAASNLLGANNTLKGDIKLPAGQPLFVRWSATGPSVRDATARVSFVRVDNPFVDETTESLQWSTDAITSFSVPTGSPSGIVLVGVPDIPAELVTFYAVETATIIAVLMFRTDASNYDYQALMVDLLGRPNMVFGIVTAGTVRELYRLLYDGTNVRQEYGSRTTNIKTTFNEGTLRIRSNAALVVDDGGELNCFAAAAGTLVQTFAVAADANARLLIQADGKLIWGSGGAAGDTNLYRTAADTLKTDDTLNVALDLNVSRNAVVLGVGDNRSEVKTADETISNNAVFQNDDHLAGFAVEANATYRFRHSGVYNTSAVADLKLNYQGPAGVTGGYCGNSRVNGAFSDVGLGAGVLQGDGAISDFDITGWLSTAGTAGTVNVQWAQNTAEVSNTVMKDGTQFELSRTA